MKKTPNILILTSRDKISSLFQSICCFFPSLYWILILIMQQVFYLSLWIFISGHKEA